LEGAKALDLNAFKKIIVMIEQKLHLTKEGLDQIIAIKNTMNRKRTDFDSN